MLPNAISHEKTRVFATIWAPRAQFWHPGSHLEVPGCVWFVTFDKLTVSVNLGFSGFEWPPTPDSKRDFKTLMQYRMLHTEWNQLSQNNCFSCPIGLASEVEFRRPAQR